ncbi:hypothetical protein ACEPAG_1797 [Sanghuangporus baumii]
MAIEYQPNERTRLFDELTDDTCVSDEEEPLSPASSSATLCLKTSKLTPFPWRAVSVILVLNAVQPLTFELVFPFINQMVLDVGVVDDPERVGYYSGIIESLFAVMSFVFVIPCSYISDCYGRKPIVLVSIAILALSSSLFGFSKSFWFMIITRASGGITAASWSTMKVMLGELTDKSNQAKAFAAFGDKAAYKVGQILGQPIGGLLAHPDRNFSLFDNNFWRTYPYAFPCLFSASFALLAVIAGCFTLNETNPRILKRNEKHRYYGTTSSDDTESLSKGAKSKASWSSILTPYVASIFTSLFLMTIASEALFVLYPLFAFTPVEFGGLGCSAAEIGAHMAVRSFVVILLMLLFAPMQSRFGTLRTYKMTMLVWPLGYLFFPFLNLLKRWNASTIVIDSVLLVFFVVWGVANCSWPASSVLINDAAPSADSLAAINGISQMVMLLPQAIVPAAVASLFAWSISSNILGGNLIWIVLIIIGKYHSDCDGSCSLIIAPVSISSLQCLTLKEPTHDWREDYKSQLVEPDS